MLANVEQGAREIHLLGQNVNAYRGEIDDGDTSDLADLIRVIAEIPKSNEFALQRVILSSSLTH